MAQPGDSADDFGSCRARSLVAIALRVPLSISARRGAVAKTRGDEPLQSGQVAGSLRLASRRKASKPPQSVQA